MYTTTDSETPGSDTTRGGTCNPLNSKLKPVVGGVEEVGEEVGEKTSARKWGPEKREEGTPRLGPVAEGDGHAVATPVVQDDVPTGVRGVPEGPPGGQRPPLLLGPSRLGRRPLREPSGARTSNPSP